jgi:hypothetical protein
LCPLAPLCAFAGVDFAAVRAHVEQFSARVVDANVGADIDHAVPVTVAVVSDQSDVVLPPDDADLAASAAARGGGGDASDHEVLAEPAAANPVAMLLDCDDTDVDALLAAAHASLARCDRCVFVSVEESDLVRHRALHDIDNHAVPCLYPGCDRSFPSRAGLRVHSRVHMVSPVHACPLPGCSEGPFLKAELKEHAKKHANLLGICTATDCGRILPNPQLLKAHLKHDHAVTFRCTFPMCARTYASYARLQRHVKEAHLRYLLPQAFADMLKLRPTSAAAARSFGPFGEQYIAAPPKRVASMSLASRLAVPSRAGEASALASRSTVVLDDDDDASVSLSGVVGSVNGDDTENLERSSSQKRTANDAAADAERNGGGGASQLSTPGSRTAAKTKRARRAPAREPSPAPLELAVGDAAAAATAATESVADVIDQLLPPPPPLRATVPNKRMSRGGGNSARRKVKALAVNESAQRECERHAG